MQLKELVEAFLRVVDVDLSRARAIHVVRCGARQTLKACVGLLPNPASASQYRAFVRMTQALTRVPCQWS